jgi:hypothetical protein
MKTPIFEKKKEETFLGVVIDNDFFASDDEKEEVSNVKVKEIEFEFDGLDKSYLGSTESTEVEDNSFMNSVFKKCD